jgi:type IV pilus assembly protein PilM
MRRSSSNRKRVIGLDIEPSHLAAADVAVDGALRVEQAAATALPPGAMRDGEVTDVEILSDALRDFFREHGLPKRVRLGMANQRMVVRILDVPPLTGKDLDAVVRFQAADQVPMPLDQCVLEYAVLGPADTPEGPRTRVMVIAARRESIDRMLAAARRAGLRVEGIDLSAFAMLRALDSGATDSPEAGATLVVNVGGMTNLAVARGSQCLFTRVAAGGLEAVVAQLAERRELTLEDSRRWLAHVGLSAAADGIDGDAETVAAARSVLVDGVRRIADDVRNSLNFYNAQPGAVPVERVVLTGAATAIGGFAEQLSAELSLPVAHGLVSEAYPGALRGLDAGRFSVAAGLAVTEARR